MGVLHHAVLWAREVTGQHRTITYKDLVHIPSDPPVWGLHNPISGDWLATFSELDALSFLQEWKDAPPLSTITEAGRARLAAEKSGT